MSISLDQSLTGGGASGTSFSLTSWTPAANDLILVAVAQRDESNAVSVSGNGLTWTQVHDIDNAQGQTGIVLYKAQGASPSTGQITVTITGNTLPVSIVAARFSGVDTSTNIEASATNAGPPVTDDNDMLQAVTTVTANAWVVACGSHRTGTFTVPGGENSIQINVLNGSGGDSTRCSMWYEGPVASPASTQLGANDDLSAAVDWCMIVVALRPASDAITVTPSAAHLVMQAPTSAAVPGGVTMSPSASHLIMAAPDAASVPGAVVLAPAAGHMVMNVPAGTVVPGAVLLAPSAAHLILNAPAVNVSVAHYEENITYILANENLALRTASEAVPGRLDSPALAFVLAEEDLAGQV